MLAQLLALGSRLMRRPRWPALLLACALLPLAARSAPPLAATTITYPGNARPDQQYDRYPVSLLRLALDKSGARYDLRFATVNMVQTRVMAEIARDHGLVDIVATMTSNEREAELLPIRIPIDRGLIGYRLALLGAQRSALFAKVRATADLRKLIAGQGHDWPDTPILRANGLQVHPVAAYESLFEMLSAGRIDYFPRSIIEIWPEAEAHRQLAVDTELAIHYPSAVYFFVNRHNTRLAEDLRRGLEAAIADGSFARLFDESYGAAIAAAHMDKRRILELNNPLLPPATPLARKELWLDFDSPRRAPAGE